MTIAGFDPSSGAGITADLAVIAAHGLFGTSAITALTVQSTTGVRAVHTVEGAVLTATLDCLAEDLPPAGIKIGMLASAENVRTVVRFLSWYKSRGPVVLDPVLVSSSGRSLLEPEGIILLKKELLPLVSWVTPNLGELAVLTGLLVQTRDEMKLAAQALQDNGLNVVATGGHLPEPDDLWLGAQGESVWFPGTKIKSTSTHGTGCAFSTSLVCGLVNGLTAPEVVKNAKHFVAEAISRAPGLGSGRGPMNLLWPLQQAPRD